MSAPLSHLLDRWDADPSFRDAAYAGGDGFVVPDAARPFFVAGLARRLERCVLAVVPTEADAEALRNAASEFITPTALLSSWDVLPYEGLSPDPRVSAQRLAPRVPRQGLPGAFTSRLHRATSIVRSRWPTSSPQIP